jgi:hypothetical protein
MIGILSDSHDNLPAVRRAVRFFKETECRLVIHAGDFVAPFAAKELAEAGCPVKAVFGNCDGERAGLTAAIEPFGTIRDAPLEFTCGGLRAAIVHLDASAAALSARQKYDVVIFGHTHKPEVRRSGKTLLVNPGETGGWISGTSTVALFDPKTGRAEIVPI